MPGSVARHVLAAEVDDVAAVLADAFADDPLFCWIYPDPRSRPAQLRDWMALNLEVGRMRGHTYLHESGTAAAIWSPPDVELFDDDDIAAIGDLLRSQLGDAASAEVFAGLGRIAEAHPTGSPHFYLETLGTAAAARSKGFGSELIDDVLARCDVQGLGAYLESSTIRNVPFYRRHGFEVREEIEVARGLVMRPMWRDPRPAR